MTSSWHPAAITVPVAAAALAAATSWAVGAAAADHAPAPVDTQQAKVRHLEHAIHKEGKQVQQLHRAIDHARDRIHRQEKAIAAQRAAIAAGAQTWSSAPTTTSSSVGASSSGSSSGSGSGPSQQAANQPNPAPNPPPNTSTGGS